MRLIYGSLLRGEILNILRRCGLYTGAANTRVYTVAISRRAESSMVRAMCGVKLVYKRNTLELMDMLRLKEAADKLVRENGVRRYHHVLRQPEKNILMKTMVHEVDGKCKQGRPRIKWRVQVEGNMKRIGLTKEAAADRCRWRENVGRISKVVGCIGPPSFTEIFKQD